MNVKILASFIIILFGLLKFMLGCLLLCISAVWLTCILKGITEHVILGAIVIFTIISLTIQLFWFSYKGISFKHINELEEKLNFYFYLFTPYNEHKIIRAIVLFFNMIYYPFIDLFCSTNWLIYWNYKKIIGRMVKKKCKGIYDDMFKELRELDIPLFEEDEHNLILL